MANLPNVRKQAPTQGTTEGAGAEGAGRARGGQEGGEGRSDAARARRPQARAQGARGGAHVLLPRHHPTAGYPWAGH